MQDGMKQGDEANNVQKDQKKTLAQKLEKSFGYHRTGFALLKIAHKVDPSSIPLRIINSVINVVKTYLELFWTARLIDMLLTGDFSAAFFYAAVLVITGLAFGVVGRLVSKVYARSRQRSDIAFAVMMREKAVSLDYETMEQPETANKIYGSERTADMYGGLGGIVDAYQGLLESLLNTVTAVGLIGTLCLSRPGTGIPVLALAAHPAVSVLAVLLFSGIAALSYFKINARSARDSGEYLRKHTGMETKVNYLLNRILGNNQAAKVVRIYDMKRMLMGNLENENKRVHSFYGEQCDMTLKKELFQNTVNGFFVVCSYLFVAVKVLAGAITIGAFTQYSGALGNLSNGFRRLAGYSSQLSRSCTYMTDFLEFMQMESSHKQGTIPVEKRLDGEYEIEFKDVSFHYPGNEEMILKHVNCKLIMKDKLALVGKNGAGKTTFVKLLCRLYEPTEGVITLNGIDIRKYKEEEYRELFGVVFQDFKLFAFPLWENIVTGYERQDARIWDCLERAGAAEFVRGLPDGIDTLLFKDKEGGVDISGGEAQKLALARALYKDAPFVVLDEPTAALDPLSEAQVYERFQEMVKGKTSVYISHRMSSCRFCDDIVVFDQGKIVERGSHDKLLAQGGHYAGMWHAQAKYYVEESSENVGA